jgi:hypothetical protein
MLATIVLLCLEELRINMMALEVRVLDPEHV